jgi:thymidylate synthase (FAD)
MGSDLDVTILAHPNFTEQHEKFLMSKNLSWIRDPIATQAENLIEFAGRVCYMSFGENNQKPGSNAEYISRLISLGHESVLEHAVWTLLISGVSRAFTHQLVRHRVGFSYSQLSQQYHDESDAEFVTPPGLSGEEFDAWTRVTWELRSLYERLRKISAPPGMSKREAVRFQRSVARSVLPNATETCIVVSANARSLRHLLKVRGSIPGDVEMRLVCRAILNQVGPEAPAAFSDFSILTADDGWPIVLLRTEARS